MLKVIIRKESSNSYIQAQVKLLLMVTTDFLKYGYTSDIGQDQDAVLDVTFGRLDDTASIVSAQLKPVVLTEF